MIISEDKRERKIVRISIKSIFIKRKNKFKENVVNIIKNKENKEILLNLLIESNVCKKRDERSFYF